MPQIYDMLVYHTGIFGGWQIGLLFTLHQCVYRHFGFIQGFMNFIHIFINDVEWPFDYNIHLLGRLTYLAYNVMHLVHYYTYFMGEATIVYGMDIISRFLFDNFYRSMLDGYPNLFRGEIWDAFNYIIRLLWHENAAWDYIRINFREAILYILGER